MFQMRVVFFTVATWKKAICGFVLWVLSTEMDSFRLLLNNHKKPLPVQMCITGCLAEQGLNGSLVDFSCLYATQSERYMLNSFVVVVVILRSMQPITYSFISISSEAIR